MTYKQGQAVEIIGPPESPYLGQVGNVQGKRFYSAGIEGVEVWINGTLEVFSASYLKGAPPREKGVRREKL